MDQPTDVTLGQSFQYEVEKESRKKQVVFEYVEHSNERLRVGVVDGIPYIVANQAGMLALAKLLITIGAGCRYPGFHLHLRQDFDGDCDEVLRIRLEDSGQESREVPDKADATAA